MKDKWEKISDNIRITFTLIIIFESIMKGVIPWHALLLWHGSNDEISDSLIFPLIIIVRYVIICLIHFYFLSLSYWIQWWKSDCLIFPSFIIVKYIWFFYIFLDRRSVESSDEISDPLKFHSLTLIQCWKFWYIDLLCLLL